MKAAGITAEVLLGIPYKQSVTLAAVVFITYVSIGGMLAVTWTDVLQGFLMLAVMLGTAASLMTRYGSPLVILDPAPPAPPAFAYTPTKPLSAPLVVCVPCAA